MRLRPPAQALPPRARGLRLERRPALAAHRRRDGRSPARSAAARLCPEHRDWISSLCGKTHDEAVRSPGRKGGHRCSRRDGRALRQARADMDMVRKQRAPNCRAVGAIEVVVMRPGRHRGEPTRGSPATGTGRHNGLTRGERGVGARGGSRARSDPVRVAISGRRSDCPSVRMGARGDDLNAGRHGRAPRQTAGARNAVPADDDYAHGLFRWCEVLKAGPEIILNASGSPFV